MTPLAKFIVSAVVAAILGSGGVVWFVVDMSLRGMEQSVDVTNDRIGDLSDDLNSAQQAILERLEAAYDGLDARMQTVIEGQQLSSGEITTLAARTNSNSSLLHLNFAAMQQLDIVVSTLARSSIELEPTAQLAVDNAVAEIRQTLGFACLEMLRSDAGTFMQAPSVCNERTIISFQPQALPAQE